MLSLKEIKILLANKFDEITLVEELGIATEDLVERFSDIIERDLPRFQELVEGDIFLEQDEDESVND